VILVCITMIAMRWTLKLGGLGFHRPAIYSAFHRGLHEDASLTTDLNVYGGLVCAGIYEGDLTSSGFMTRADGQRFADPRTPKYRSTYGVPH